MMPELTWLAQEVTSIDEHLKQLQLSLSGSEEIGCSTAKLRSLFPFEEAIQQQCDTLDKHTAYAERMKVLVIIIW